jgi:hypothetical protein
MPGTRESAARLPVHLPGQCRQPVGTNQFLSPGLRHAWIDRNPAYLDPKSTTISTIIFQPQAGQVRISDGQPCQTDFQVWKLN